MSMKNDSLFNNLIQIRTEIEFFEKLVKLGILDSTNEYIQSLLYLSNKIVVNLYKKNICIDDVKTIFDLYDRFNLIIFNLFKSLRKE